MSDIAPRPWSIAPGFEHDWIKSADGSVVSVENQPHVVACVNAIYAASITPEALARDPECVAKLVEAAREVLTSVPSSYDNDDPMVQRHARALNALPDVFRACGIEVTP